MNAIKKVAKQVPIIAPVAKSVYRNWISPRKPFTSSKSYWIDRYDSGGNSGDGSYRQLAQFKADILNAFVREKKVKTIIEYGCGDGNQLRLAEYPSYIGFDVSPKALTLCREIFAGDTSKTFKLMDEYKREKAQLTLSLDVIYHLIEDKTFDEYLHRLFDSAEEFVIVYSSNSNENSTKQAPHVRHRKFSEWVEELKPEWELSCHIPNKHPYTGDTKSGSIADFYIYKKLR